MKPHEVEGVLNRLIDGQALKVHLASGRVFDGVFDSENTSMDFLYFETMEGKTLRAGWGDILDIGFRSARMTVGDRFVVPPEHPLSGAAPAALRPYTVRNP